MINQTFQPEENNEATKFSLGHRSAPAIPKRFRIPTLKKKGGGGKTGPGPEEETMRLLRKQNLQNALEMEAKDLGQVSGLKRTHSGGAFTRESYSGRASGLFFSPDERSFQPLFHFSGKRQISSRPNIISLFLTFF